MTDGMYRIAIVGAGSLVAKELADELQDSLLAASDFVLLDDDEGIGQVASVGDEASFIQRIEPGSFDGMDFVFLAGSEASARKHFPAARSAGASVIDMTCALEAEKGVLVRAPWVQTMVAKRPDDPNLGTPALVAAHPVALMLGLVAARLSKGIRARSLAATVIEPASQHGREAMDELHRQTVNLLSFQDLPKEQYAAQVAFNVLPTLGESAKVKLLGTEEQILRHYRKIGGEGFPVLDLELVQAPVFHGYVASVLLEVEEATTVEEVERHLAGNSIDVVGGDSEPPSNLSAAGQEDIMVRVRRAGDAGTRFWIWLAADNLKLTALNAIACANELRRLRPQGKVQ